MTRPRDLSRELSLAMTGVTIAGLLSTLVAFTLVYGLIQIFAPRYYPSVTQATMDLPDFVSLVLAALIGLAVASLVAVRVARRIARPLQSVARAAQQIAQGNLSTRATPDDQAPEEAAALIADFNDMAGRLEAAAQRMVTWNAQIAHELRTPITILNGRLQGVVDGVFEPDERLTTGLLAQVTILRRLVEDLRVVSLADSGRLDLKLDTIELADEIAALAEFVGPDLEAGGFSLQLDLDAGAVVVDIARVRQALLALIDNARHHADPGALLITLRLPPDEIIIEVIDSGPGLPAEFAPFAFGEFARAEATRRTGRAGSGLGLSVVRAIAQAHGGEAQYRRSGSGSAFAIKLHRNSASRD